MAPRISMRTVKGTSVITNFGVGQSTLQKLVPGAALDGTQNVFGKISLKVDTVVLARAVVPLLEDFQTSYDARVLIGQEHGKKIAKFFDQSFFIQGFKAASTTTSAYQGLTGVGSGHFGASQQVLAAAGDENDPAKLYVAILDLCTKMENKDVDVQTDDIALYVKPVVFNTLIQNEQLIDSTYITATGNSIQGYVLKANGMPVVKSNNLPAGETITGHFLSNADNGNAYDGNFSKDLILALAPSALMAGSTIPLSTIVFWDDIYKHWYIDAWLSYAVGPNQTQYAGKISAA